MSVVHPQHIILLRGLKGMTQSTCRVVTREDEHTGDLMVTQSDANEAAGRQHLENTYPNAEITRVRSPQLDALPFLFWRVRLHSPA